MGSMTNETKQEGRDKPMRVYLDDVRQPPPDWVLVRTAAEAIALLQDGRVTELSLDHDLGGDRTGMEVLNWIEEAVVEGNFQPPELLVHSSNPVGRANLQRAIESVQRLLQKRDDTSLR
jgi:hypothetical protein